MSAYTTLYITQDKAREFIAHKFFSATNHELERMLEIFIESRLYSAIVVPNGSEANNDDEL